MEERQRLDCTSPQTPQHPPVGPNRQVMSDGHPSGSEDSQSVQEPTSTHQSGPSESLQSEIQIQQMRTVQAQQQMEIKLRHKRQQRQKRTGEDSSLQLKGRRTVTNGDSQGNLAHRRRSRSSVTPRIEPSLFVNLDNVNPKDAFQPDSLRSAKRMQKQSQMKLGLGIPGSLFFTKPVDGEESFEPWSQRHSVANSASSRPCLTQTQSYNDYSEQSVSLYHTC